MTTKRPNARSLLKDDSPETVVKRLLLVIEARDRELKAANEAAQRERAHDYPRPIHLARLSALFMKQAKNKHRKAVRMVLRHINPQLSDPLPDELEDLAKRAAKLVSDLVVYEPFDLD